MSLRRPYAACMIDLGSIAGLHEHRHELHAYCQRCYRWSILPLAELVASGRGSSRLPLTVRCRDCHEIGRLQVRPPMPTHPRSVGWMETRWNKSPSRGRASVLDAPEHDAPAIDRPTSACGT
jgi:hypothetical protein